MIDCSRGGGGSHVDEEVESSFGDDRRKIVEESAEMWTKMGVLWRIIVYLHDLYVRFHFFILARMCTPFAQHCKFKKCNYTCNALRGSIPTKARSYIFRRVTKYIFRNPRLRTVSGVHGHFQRFAYTCNVVYCGKNQLDTGSRISAPKIHPT